MDVVLRKLQQFHTGNLLQELKDAHAIGWIHVALEKLTADGDHLIQLQHIRCHHEFLNILYCHIDCT